MGYWRGTEIGTWVAASLIAVLVAVDASRGEPVDAVEAARLLSEPTPVANLARTVYEPSHSAITFVAVVLPSPPLMNRELAAPTPSVTFASMAATDPKSPTSPKPTPPKSPTMTTPSASKPSASAPPTQTPDRMPVQTPARAQGASGAASSDVSGAPAGVDIPAAVRALTSASTHSGGAMLRLIEMGKGPDIRLGWPSSGLRREALYRTLSRCHSLRLVLAAPDGRLTGVEEAELGRASGLVREIDGPLTREEHRRLKALLKQAVPGSGIASGGAGVRPVRLFDRDFDRRLIGGLARLADRPLMEVGAVRASLSTRARDVIVDNILLDGTRVRGRVVIPSPPGCG